MSAATKAPVQVGQLFNRMMNRNRPHESNVAMVGSTPIAEMIPTAAPISLASCSQSELQTKSSKDGSKNRSKSSNSLAKTGSLKKACTYDEKKLRRREQNRRAAVKSRKRKKVYMQELETKVKKLKETNDELLARMQVLLAENEKLKHNNANAEAPRALTIPIIKTEDEVSTAEEDLMPPIATVVKTEPDSSDGISGSDTLVDTASHDSPGLWESVDETDQTQGKGDWPMESFQVGSFFAD